MGTRFFHWQCCWDFALSRRAHVSQTPDVRIFSKERLQYSITSFENFDVNKISLGFKKLQTLPTYYWCQRRESNALTRLEQPAT